MLIPRINTKADVLTQLFICMFQLLQTIAGGMEAVTTRLNYFINELIILRVILYKLTSFPMHAKFPYNNHKLFRIFPQNTPLGNSRVWDRAKIPKSLILFNYCLVAGVVLTCFGNLVSNCVSNSFIE